MEDREEVENVSVFENLESIRNSKVENNGFYEIENDDHNELLSDVKGKGNEDSESVSSPPTMEMNSEASPSSTRTRKGYGLKKWRRIRRDVSKGGESSADTMEDLEISVVKPSKRMQFNPERQQNSEGSVSSTNAIIGGLDVFALLGDSGLAMGPSEDAGTDSENSEDWSSKSSTAASFPKIKSEIPVLVGFPHDKSRMRSLTGKNSTHAVHRGQQGKVRIEAIKKSKGERVNIEKENSHSSMESDSRSSNFLSTRGTYATSNGIRSERPIHHDVENGDQGQGDEQKFSNGLRGGYSRDSERGYEEILPEDEVAGLSWEVKKDKSENNGPSSEQDPLVESILGLQTAQEALEKEVLKFKEISVDALVDDSVSDTHLEFTDVEQKLQETSSEQFPSGKGAQSCHQAVQSDLVDIANRVVETELEELFKQRIEAEVEYLAISRMVPKLRVASVDPNTILEEQKSPASKQNQIVDNLGDTENKAVMLKNAAEKLKRFSEDAASANEMLKLQKRMCKYTSYFVVQLLLLLIILGILIFHSSPNYAEVVPT